MAKEDFKEIAVVTDSDNLIEIVITCRDSAEGPKYSFAVMRGFIQTDGNQGRTCWHFSRHVDAIKDALDELENWFEKQERIDRLAKKGKQP
jgi:hypothetical protein